MLDFLKPFLEEKNLIMNLRVSFIPELAYFAEELSTSSNVPLEKKVLFSQDENFDSYNLETSELTKVLCIIDYIDKKYNDIICHIKNISTSLFSDIIKTYSEFNVLITKTTPVFIDRQHNYTKVENFRDDFIEKISKLTNIELKEGYHLYFRVFLDMTLKKENEYFPVGIQIPFFIDFYFKKIELF